MVFINRISSGFFLCRWSKFLRLTIKPRFCETNFLHKSYKIDLLCVYFDDIIFLGFALKARNYTIRRQDHILFVSGGEDTFSIS